MSAVETLIELVKFSPGLSKINVEVDWPKFEESVGIYFPDDYKKIIDFFGAGSFFDFFTFALPVDYGTVSFKELLKSLTDLRSIREEALRNGWIASEECVPFWPERNGLLPFIVTPSSTRLYWKTALEDNAWTICAESDAFVYTYFPFSIAEYLVNLLSSEKDEKLFESREGLSIVPASVRKTPYFVPEKRW